MADEFRYVTRWIEGYRWCPLAEDIQAWEEGQEFGCAFCPESAEDQLHHKLVSARYADAAWGESERLRGFLATIRNAEIGEPEEVVAQMVAHYRAATRSRTLPGVLTNLVRGLTMVGVRAIANGRWARNEHEQAVRLRDALAHSLRHHGHPPGICAACDEGRQVVAENKLDDTAPESGYAVDLDLPRPDPDVESPPTPEGPAPADQATA